MASITTGARTGTGSPGWARKYPPLLLLVAAALIAITVLPSSLNLPQSNPTQTLEFAPVPPDDEDEPPPPQGNLSALGLASTSGLSGAGPGGAGPGEGLLPPPDDDLGGQGKTPFTKDCVNQPERGLRQTDDPLAPPCVADFRGDNGGATWQGVTQDEVRVLFYFQGFYRYTNICREPNQITPDGKYFDLAQPPEEGEHCIIRVLRNWQNYFNRRYQTYDRFVHFFVYVSGQGETPEERRADAADNFNKIKPFAVITTAESHNEAYLEVMAKRQVLNFGSFLSQQESFFQRFPGFVWGYPPSLEIQARSFASYLCTKADPHPVQYSRNAGENGQPRVFGMWRTSDPTRPELHVLAREVKRRVQDECGMTFATENTFPSAGHVQDNRYSPRYATEAVADFRTNGVTTIIWPGGRETNLTKESNRAGYLPEIIALGDGVLEGNASGTFQDQNAYDQAIMVTNVVQVADVRQQSCYRAYKEQDPTADHNETVVSACETYPSIRQLFTGIQVAGPQLTPQSVDQGFHAIPAIRSTDPAVPACFYDPGDYTCVKDALVERWDRTANDGQGCYRATEGGLRYFAGAWPQGNVQDQQHPDDPCNQYSTGFTVNPAPPDDPNNL